MAELQTQLSNINFMSKERFDALETIDDGQLYAVEFPFTDDDLVHTTGNEEINGVKTFNDEIYAPNQVDYTQITNCITEIPQDIKLELVDGTLTLKAGSKVYVPNGADIFDEIIISSDISKTNNYNGTYMVICNKADDIYLANITSCLSGNIDNRPTSLSTNTGLYFATDENKMYLTGNSGTDWYSSSNYSFPIAIITVTNDNISSIDQIFNGFGHIGKTRFFLPGLKGLAPDGLNEDGSVKNYEWELKEVSTYTLSRETRQVYFTVGIGFNNYYPYYNQDTEPETNGLWYSPKENIMRVKSASNPIWRNIKQSLIATAEVENGYIISLNPKLPFRAVDYNDFNKLDEEVAKLGANNTFTSSNTFSNVITSKKTDMNINFINPNYDSTTIPTTIQNQYIVWEDKNGVDMSYIQQVVRGETGNTECNMVGSTYKDDGTRVTSAIKAGARRDGTVYTSAPTPPVGDNSFQIATTEWCYDPTKSTNLVHRTGDERIGGSKTFTSTFALESGSVQPIMKSTAYTKGTAPKGDTYMLHRIYMENGNKSVFDEYYYIPGTTNRPTYILRMQNVSSADATGHKDIIKAWYDGTNSQYSIQSSKATAPTPVAGSNNTEIATTNWCYDPTKSTNLVHRTGDETIAGTKTFSSTIQGTAYRALWGDLAEYYESDKEYPRGTLVQFGGEKEITIANNGVNAVITSEPGFILNTQQHFNAQNSQAIALVGKVPVRVIGKVNKFDYLTLSDIPGVAISMSNVNVATHNIIARALESKNSEGEGLVLCVIKFAL